MFQGEIISMPASGGKAAAGGAAGKARAEGAGSEAAGSGEKGDETGGGFAAAFDAADEARTDGGPGKPEKTAAASGTTAGAAGARAVAGAAQGPEGAQSGPEGGIGPQVEVANALTTGVPDLSPPADEAPADTPIDAGAIAADAVAVAAAPTQTGAIGSAPSNPESVSGERGAQNASATLRPERAVGLSDAPSAGAVDEPERMPADAPSPGLPQRQERAAAAAGPFVGAGPAPRQIQAAAADAASAAPAIDPDVAPAAEGAGPGRDAASLAERPSATMAVAPRTAETAAREAGANAAQHATVALSARPLDEAAEPAPRIGPEGDGARAREGADAPKVAMTAAPNAAEKPVAAGLADATVSASGEVDFAGPAQEARAGLRLEAAAAPHAPLAHGAGGERVASQVAGHIAAALNGGKADGETLELRLDPPELGRVRLSFTISDMGLTAVVSADRPETLDLMRRNGDMLQRELADAGYERVSLDFGGGGDGREQGGEGRSDAESGPRSAEPAKSPAPWRRLPAGEDRLDIRI